MSIHYPLFMVVLQSRHEDEKESRGKHDRTHASEYDKETGKIDSAHPRRISEGSSESTGSMDLGRNFLFSVNFEERYGCLAERKKLN